METSIFGAFNEKMEAFLTNLNQVLVLNDVPEWFKNFAGSMDSFAKDIAITIKAVELKVSCLESQLAVQKAVIDGLDADRTRLFQETNILLDDLEEQRQYSRRNNIVIHGVNESTEDDTEKEVLHILQDMLDLPISRYEVGRTHRLGRKNNVSGETKNRPIIVRFVSYRQKKMTFDAKKKLKGKGIVITESLTKERYTLLKKCFDVYGKENVWTYDGRIYCVTGDSDFMGRKERIVVPREEDLIH